MAEFVLAALGLGAGVFAASAAAKLRGRRAHRDYLAGLRATLLVPERRLPFVALVLVIAEVILAVSLATAAGLVAAHLTGAIPLAESALGLAAGLSAVLTAGVATVVRRGTRATCACFGARSGRPLSVAHAVRNACLLAATLAGLGGSTQLHAVPTPAASALSLAAGLVVAVVFVGWDDLAYLFGPAAKPASLRGKPPRPNQTAR